MNLGKPTIFLAAVAGSAFIGILTYRVLIADPDTDEQAKPVFQVRHQRASSPAAATSPLPPLSLGDKDCAFAAVGGEDHRQIQDRIMGWRRDGRVISEEDGESMLAFLGHEQPAGMTSGEWEERVNEILNLLRSQPGGVAGLADAMLEMERDEISPVMRMYVLQHVFLWIPDEPSAEKREAMMSFLRGIAENPADMHAGAAVMYLSDLERGGARPEEMADDGIINRAALRLAEDSGASADVRISALHTCTERGVTDALRAARAIAADTTQMIPLRKAAIHCIGQLGETEDKTLLESIANENRVFTAATKPALERLER